MTQQGVNNAEATKTCFNLWKKTTPNEKQKYKEMQKEDAKRFNSQLLELKTFGFFTL